MNAAMDFPPSRRRLECPVKHVNPDRYMFAQGVTSMEGPDLPVSSKETMASRAFYIRERPGNVTNDGKYVLNQDDGEQFYVPHEHQFLGVAEMQAVVHEQNRPWSTMTQTKLLHGKPVC